MEDLGSGTDLHLVYNHEIWYISSFINTTRATSIRQISQNFESFLSESFRRINEKTLDIPPLRGKEEVKQRLLQMVQTVQFKCNWRMFIEDLPINYQARKYNMLGYFEIEVDYSASECYQNQKILPSDLQSIPIFIKGFLEDAQHYEASYEKLKDILFDLDSPFYDFVIVTEIKPPFTHIKWTEENIHQFKQELGDWIEIYSGHWPDYSDAIYNFRVHDNLSNRYSELHFLRHNSGLIYMEQENYNLHFEAYMRPNVLHTTAAIRSTTFALLTMMDILDNTLKMSYNGTILDLPIIEEKLNDLQYLRGLIQSKLGKFYDELHQNRRQHYTAVLKKLLDDFQLNTLMGRIESKFDHVSKVLKTLYSKKLEETEEKNQKRLDLLNVLLGAETIFIIKETIFDLANITKVTNHTAYYATNIILSTIILLGLVYVILAKFIQPKPNVKYLHTTDAIILNSDNKILMTQRGKDPYLNYYALPGGLVESGEDYRDSIVREIREEVLADIEIIRELSEFSHKDRDPRGNVISHVYLCRLISETYGCGEDTKKIFFATPEEIQPLRLAFDHKRILKDTGILDRSIPELQKK